MNAKRTWLPAFLLLGITWGLSFLFIEKALNSFTPFGIAYYRIVLGTLVLLIWGTIRNCKPIFNRDLIKHFLVVAILLNSFPFLMFAIAQQYISSSLAGMLNATTPIFSILLIGFIFKTESVTASQILGVVLGVGGVIILLAADFVLGDNKRTGILLVLLATIGYGIAFPYAKRNLSNRDYSPTSLALTQLIFASLILTPFIPFLKLQKSSFSQLSIVALIILGAFGTGFAYIWNFTVIARAGGAIASSVTLISPLVATFAGVLILREKLTFSQVIGGLLIILSAAFIQKRISLPSRRRIAN